jgi:hypothetical protein
MMTDGTVEFGGLRHRDRLAAPVARREIRGGWARRAESTATSVNFTACCLCVRYPAAGGLRRRCGWHPHCGERQATLDLL